MRRRTILRVATRCLLDGREATGCGDVAAWNEWQREGWPQWPWSSWALEGASEAAQQKQDFGLRAAIDAIVVGLVDSTRILVIS
jgi:hypothetical protein